MLKNISAISVVIPAYNESKRIKNALTHTLAFLKSSKVKFEIIVVDDCSKDNTVSIVENFDNISSGVVEM